MEGLHDHQIYHYNDPQCMKTNSGQQASSMCLTRAYHPTRVFIKLRSEVPQTNCVVFCRRGEEVGMGYRRSGSCGRVSAERGNSLRSYLSAEVQGWPKGSFQLLHECSHQSLPQSQCIRASHTNSRVSHTFWLGQAESASVVGDGLSVW